MICAPTTYQPPCSRCPHSCLSYSARLLKTFIHLFNFQEKSVHVVIGYRLIIEGRVRQDSRQELGGRSWSGGCGRTLLTPVFLFSYFFLFLHLSLTFLFSSLFFLVLLLLDSPPPPPKQSSTRVRVVHLPGATLLEKTVCLHGRGWDYVPCSSLSVFTFIYAEAYR